MKTRVFTIIALCLLFAGRASAQWAVIDPSNIAQSIINAGKNIAQTTTTAQNMVKNFRETVKIYEQGKKYYDSYRRMLHDSNFSPAELSAIAFGYTKLLEESNDVLKELKQVVNITTLSMTDKDRMDVVDRCYMRMKNYRNLVNYYTNKNISVSYLRAKKRNDLDRVMALYGNANQRYW